MMQSEFYDRTHMNLTGDAYEEVQEIYNGVKMNKDEFCKHWVEERLNPLFKELAAAYIQECKKHRLDVSKLEADIKSLKEDSDKYKEQKEKEIEKNNSYFEQQHVEFAKRVVRANCDGDLRVEEVIEEEFGYGFIIRAKHEAGIPLSNEEIGYMVSKL